MKDIFDRLKKIFERGDKIPTAEEAYYTTMYGIKLTREEEVEIHRGQIASLIKSKMLPEIDGTIRTQFSSHYCVYDIPEEVAEFTDEIFRPFVEKGFGITCISEMIGDIRSKHLYLISWDKPAKGTQDDESKKK